MAKEVRRGAGRGQMSTHTKIIADLKRSRRADSHCPTPTHFYRQKYFFPEIAAVGVVHQQYIGIPTCTIVPRRGREWGDGEDLDRRDVVMVKLKRKEAAAPPEDDMFAMGLPTVQIHYNSVLKPSPRPPPEPEQPSITWRSVTSCEPVAASAAMHPIDRHRTLTKSLGQIKRHKLEKRAARAAAQRVGDYGMAAKKYRQVSVKHEEAKKLPYRARQDEAMAATHRRT